MPLIQFSNLNKYGTIRKRILYTPSLPFNFDSQGFGPIVSITPFKYQYKHYLPPILLNARDGKKYILPTWQEVLPETTLDDIEWIKYTSEKTLSHKNNITPNKWTFESKSEPGNFYTVTQNNDKFRCDCPGVFRSKDKECKHIKEVKKNTK